MFEWFLHTLLSSLLSICCTLASLKAKKWFFNHSLYLCLFCHSAVTGTEPKASQRGALLVSYNATLYSLHHNTQKYFCLFREAKSHLITWLGEVISRKCLLLFCFYLFVCFKQREFFQKRVNLAVPRLPLFKRPGWPLAGIWKLRVPTILTGNTGALCLHYLYEHSGFCWTAAFPLQSGMWNVLGSGVYMTRSQEKNPEHRSPWLPELAAFHMCWHWSLGRGQIVCDLTGPGFLETGAWFPLDVAPHIFPFSDFTLDLLL